MTSLPYHPAYVRLRRMTPAGGYLAGWPTFSELLAIGRRAPCTLFLVDAGDRRAEVAHRAAKRDQHATDYRADRLRAPRYTFAEEDVLLSAVESGDGAFLELVMAGDDALDGWFHSGALAGEEATHHDDPLDIHCHTPLNQRLLPAQLRICQWLVETLPDVVRSVPPNTARPVVGSLCIVELGVALNLGPDGTHTLADFGLDYLAQYLGLGRLAVEELGASPAAARRVDQIEALLAVSDHTSPRFPDAMTEQGLLFPESLWMQCHWFLSSLGVSLRQELALAVALRDLTLHEPFTTLTTGSGHAA